MKASNWAYAFSFKKNTTDRKDSDQDRPFVQSYQKFYNCKLFKQNLYRTPFQCVDTIG